MPSLWESVLATHDTEVKAPLCSLSTLISYLLNIYLFDSGSSQLQHAGSLVVAFELLFGACEIYFPDRGLNLNPALGMRSLSHWTSREVPDFLSKHLMYHTASLLRYLDIFLTAALLTLVHSPGAQQSLNYWHQLMERGSQCLWLCTVPSKENGQFVLQRPELPDGFQESVLKDNILSENCSSWIFTRLVDGEATGWYFRNHHPLVPTSLESSACGQHVEYSACDDHQTLCGWEVFSSVQSLSHAQLFVTPRLAARQASLSLTNSQSLLKLMSIESVMPSYHLILCHPLPAFNPSQHQGVFQWASSLHQVAKVLEFQLLHQSFQWIFRTGFL